MPKFDESKPSWMDCHDDNLVGIMPVNLPQLLAYAPSTTLERLTFLKIPGNRRSRSKFRKQHLEAMEHYVLNYPIKPDEPLRPQIEDFLVDVCNADITDPTPREKQFVMEMLNKFNRTILILIESKRYRPGFLLQPPGSEGYTQSPPLTWQARSPEQVEQDRLVTAFLALQSHYAILNPVALADVKRDLAEIIVDAFCADAALSERDGNATAGIKMRNPWIPSPLQLLKKVACRWYLKDAGEREWIDFIPRYDVKTLDLTGEKEEEKVLRLVEEEMESWIPDDEEESGKRERKCELVVMALGGTWGVSAVGDLIKEIQRAGA
ncbi:hypothetical protein BJ508DRAFT_310991 [Ascobolus immersus RN42]|uniref:Uncharacterized protein n=1 Tax=Ascobolus immersus RN42 TaxID=1160509 RepID=A0A3N4HRL4_ASCIM|nr:hypothetical protein BJ508DRAFT_310991 [Ascobolus immersus RN42]